ncbi:hypothetical protein [Alloactinosynnema sp. L-07]|uniref:hypothetical protein n=1 Tax=Alloactinosynnema sp. L-07 TaxID=1653480 RepID=UPI00065EF41D|nr:hypothetical protein [Alloactinosynnema sp. L-07]CRK62170.1 hypothetical protein [Alloactinosynnema sp. L-07]
MTTGRWISRFAGVLSSAGLALLLCGGVNAAADPDREDKANRTASHGSGPDSKADKKSKGEPAARRCDHVKRVRRGCPAPPPVVVPAEPPRSTPPPTPRLPVPTSATSVHSPNPPQSTPSAGPPPHTIDYPGGTGLSDATNLSTTPTPTQPVALAGLAALGLGTGVLIMARRRATR